MTDRLNHKKYRFSFLDKILPIFAITGALYFVNIFTIQDSLLLLFAVIVCGLFLLSGLRNPAFGFFLAIAIMNNIYDLVPKNISGGYIVSSLWDFGFIYMFLVSLRFMPNIVKQKETIFPIFTKYFFTFLIVLTISIILSLISLPYPLVDTFRSFRDYLGYLFIPVLIVLFNHNSPDKLTPEFNKLLQFTSHACLILLILYNIQFLTKLQIFQSHTAIYKSYGQEYNRTIPTFFMISYFFFWIFVAKLLNGKHLPLWKWLYILLSLSATMFTFTRGIYISIALLSVLLIITLVQSKKINTARFTLSITILLLIISTLIISSLANPYVARIQSISGDLQTTGSQSTSKYRRRLVEDRIKIIKEHNVLLGIGFVHPKYAFRDYGPFLGNHAPNEVPSIGCADIAWGNIIYQTGLLGIVTFLLYILTLLYFIITKLPQYQGEVFFLQLASCYELLRNIILMFIGANYTYQTQNIAFLIAISAYLHTIHSRRNSKRI